MLISNTREWQAHKARDNGYIGSVMSVTNKEYLESRSQQQMITINRIY